MLCVTDARADCVIFEHEICVDVADRQIDTSGHHSINRTQKLWEIVKCLQCVRNITFHNIAKLGHIIGFQLKI